jgi:NADH-quinone oxidoreductase subunit L
VLQLIGILPLIPLVGVVINGLFGRKLSARAAGRVGSATVLLAFLLSIGAVWELSQLPSEERHVQVDLGTWMPLGSVGGGEALRLGWGFALDPLSAVMILIVTGVGFLIHVYSIGYMAHEESPGRFFTYLNLFMR